MTVRRHSYHFETRDQWDACLFARTDRDAALDVVRPYAPYEQPPTVYETDMARMPWTTAASETFWLGSGGRLHRLMSGGERDESTAPHSIAAAKQVIGTSAGLWIRSRESIGLLETDSYTFLFSAELPEGRLVGMASNGDEAIIVLMENRERWFAHSLDSEGRVKNSSELPGLSDGLAFTYLKASKRFAVLTGGPQPKLLWFQIKSDGAALPVATRIVGGLAPCFSASGLVGDGVARVFVSGRNSDEFGGDEFIHVFDADGNSIAEIPIGKADAPIRQMAADRTSIAATGSRALMHFVASKTVPDNANQVTATLVTPMLFSADREDGRRWLRVEATADLPEGSMLEISYAAADTPDEIRFFREIFDDKTSPASHRIDKLLADTELWKGKIAFQGSGPGGTEKKFAIPLFEEKSRYVVVTINLYAAPRGSLPTLAKLDVLYPGRSLMENLPAIYQKQEANPNSFLRSLVGVLETTTQDVDARIAAMGSLIDPVTAPPEWLDYVAGWLGVPWDEALSEKQKRCILARAAEITRHRGTRKGLEVFLECLLGAGRFRVIDATADFGFAWLGGGSCAGTALPAMLGTGSNWKTELGFSTVLGHMRLKSYGDAEDELAQLVGVIRIDIAATAAEQKMWQPWLGELINEMIPITSRFDLRWVPQIRSRTNVLDDWAILDEEPPDAHLDTNAITGIARLPERKSLRSDSDPIIGHRLQ